MKKKSTTQFIVNIVNIDGMTDNLTDVLLEIALQVCIGNEVVEDLAAYMLTVAGAEEIADATATARAEDLVYVIDEAIRPRWRKLALAKGPLKPA